MPVKCSANLGESTASNPRRRESGCLSSGFPKRETRMTMQVALQCTVGAVSLYQMCSVGEKKKKKRLNRRRKRVTSGALRKAIFPAEAARERDDLTYSFDGFEGKSGRYGERAHIHTKHAEYLLEMRSASNGGGHACLAAHIFAHFHNRGNLADDSACGFPRYATTHKRHTKAVKCARGWEYSLSVRLEPGAS